jgi:hypothetical protein
MPNNLFDRVFKDETGKIVVAQMPNLPLITWGVSSLLQIVISSGKINLLMNAIAFGAIFTWAWEELFQGVNYFRRGLGAIVLCTLLYSKITLT